MARGNNKSNGKAIKLATKEDTVIPIMTGETMKIGNDEYKVVVLDGTRVPVPNDVAPKGRDPDAVSIAVRNRKRAEAIEPQLTASMIRIARELGGKNEGLEFRIKTTDSLARKIKDDAKMENITMEQAAAKIGDLVRYTLVFTDKNYTKDLKATVQRLEKDGYEVSVKNFWKPGDPYQGVNMNITKNGVKSELQVHTPESFRVKQYVTHKDYEDYRAKNLDGTYKFSKEERLKMFERMAAVADKIPLPDGYADMMKVGKEAFHPFSH